MSNRIKRDTIFIVAKTLTDSSALKSGAVVGNYKDDTGRWLFKDENGKCWQNLIGHLRNENYFEILEQYSMSDIIYYLFWQNEDYQTVLWETLVDAVHTTFKESTVNDIADIYKYISENLI